jgi:hypothetical protein
MEGRHASTLRPQMIISQGESGFPEEIAGREGNAVLETIPLFQ